MSQEPRTIADAEVIPSRSLIHHLEKKLVDPSHISSKVAELRSHEISIATINGSFDLMHAGHLEILYQASLQADALIVALNTDASIKSYKGPTRPIINLHNRAKMMAAIEFVTHVTWFDEEDPRNILTLIQPDVHVNGAEYGENCIEAEVVKKYGGRIHIVNLVPGLSTSTIINKIKNPCAS